MGKARTPDGKKDFIQNLKAGKKRLRSPKHSLNLSIDYALWERAHPHLEGQFSELMEQALASYLEQLEKKSG